MKIHCNILLMNHWIHPTVLLIKVRTGTLWLPVRWRRWTDGENEASQKRSGYEDGKDWEIIVKVQQIVTMRQMTRV